MDRNATQVRCQYCGTQAYRKPHTRILLPTAVPSKPQRSQPQRPQPVHTTPPRVHGYPWLLGIPLIGLSLGGAYFAYSQASSSQHIQTSSRVHHTPTTTRTPTSSGQPRVEKSEPAEPKPQKTTKTQKKTKKSRSKKKHSKQEPSATPSASTNVLTKPTAKRVLRRVHMLHCTSSGDVTVSITIAPSGQVSNTSTKTGDAQAGRCVADTVDQLRFPASIKGLSTSHRYRW